MSEITTPSKKEWDGIYRAFNGEDYAFVDDPDIRAYMEIYSGYDTPEEAAQSWALARYYSQMNREGTRLVHDNLESAIRHYHGKDLSIPEAFAEVRGILNGEPVQDQGIFGKTGWKLYEGALGTFKTAANAANELVGIAAAAAAADANARYSGQQLLLTGEVPEDNGRINSPAEARKIAATPGREFINKHWTENIEAAQELSTVPSDWVTSSKNVGDWCENFFSTSIGYAPNLAAQIALMYATGGTASLGVVTGLDQLAELEDNENMSTEQKFTNALLTGFINAGLEKVTLGIIEGKISAELMKHGIKSGITKALGHFAISSSIEGTQEGIEQFAQNATDILTGVYGDWRGWDQKTWTEKMTAGVPESVMLGMSSGFTMSMGSYWNFRKLDQIAQKDRKAIADRITELENRDKLSAGDDIALAELKLMDDAASVQELEQAVFEIKQKQAVEDMLEQIRANDPEADPLDNAVNEADRRLKLAQKLPHNPADTVEAGTLFAETFPNVSVTFFDAAEGLPPSVENALHDIDPSADIMRVNGFTWGGKVYINASTVRPSEVRAKIMHEVVGHLGIKDVYGKHWDDFLDSVWKEHGATSDFARTVRSYFPDKISVSEEINEDNFFETEENQKAFSLKLDNIEDQRLAAEEYVAHLAELPKEWKPAWWREKLQQIRLFLRGFHGVDFTEREIETAILRGLRAAKSKRFKGGKDLRFAVIGEDGAQRLHNAEVLISNLATAKMMTDSGKDAKTIKLATGWEKGGDGKWRMEVPDLELKTEARLPDGTTFERSLWDIVNTTNGKLSDYIDAPELFEAYPQLKDIKLESVHDLPPTIGGRFIASKSKIELNSLALGLSERDSQRIEQLEKAIARTYNWTEKDEKNRKLLRIEETPEQIREKDQEEINAINARYMNLIRSIMIHEVQHAIQHQEGFTTGSNTDYFVNHPVRNPEYVKAAEDAIVKEYELQQKLAEYPDLYQEAYRFLYLEEHYFDDNVDTDAVDKELEDIEQQFRDMGQEELFKEFRIAVLDRQNAQRRAEKSELSPTEAYTRTAGEVEARNAQKRANMSMEERRQMLLDETADVAPEDRIYIEQLLDSSMALFDNKEKSRKIISALQKIADGSEEETVPGLRNDLAQYGGTNDITFYWGNEKKGIYHIAYRRGVKTLFHVIDAVADGRILRHVDGNKTVILEKDGFEAVLALTEYGNQKSWLLSGWEVEQPDANGEVSTQSAATQSEPTFSRQELGAGLKGNIPQNPDNASLESKKTGRFSISPVWTGSAADYDKPSLHYIGTGEGAQAYGWGLYGSSEREIGEFYAKADARRKAQQEEVLFDGKSIHPDMAANLDEWESIKAAILWVKQNKGDIDAAISELQGYIDNGEDYSTDDIAFVQRAIDFLKNNRERILYVHASDLTGNRNLYSQTFFPDKEENLLDWDNPVPDQQMQMIADQGAKEGLPFVYSEDGKNVFNESNTSGMWVYEQLCKPYNGLGSPKAVSEFLYRAGIDGITYIGDSSGVRNYVAFSDEDIRIDEHIRFSLTGYSDQRIDDLVTVLRPFAGYVMNHSDAEYLEYFKSKGYDVESEADAHAFAVLAIAENKAAKLKAGRERRQAKILEDYPFIAHAMQLAGGDWNFKIVPSLKHYGEEFTGSFIAKEWKTKKSDKENTGVDAVSKNMKRKTKLENAKGVRSEELARQIAQVTGENENDVEQIIVDFFRDLTKPQLFNQYKNERELQDRQFREEAEEFRRSQESARINEEAAEFVKWGGDIMQLVKDDREVARKVYELIMGTPLNDNLRVVNPDGSTSAADWDAVTNALNSPEYADRHAIAKAWRDAYDQAEKIHEEEIRSLREKINADIENTVQLQREAQKYANRNLAPEQRAKFVGRIITLVRYSNIPTKNNPEGRRMREFYALLKEMAETGKQDRKNKAIERIRETVDKNRTKRTSKGVPTSILEDRQPIVDYIAQIVRWSPEVVAENRSYLAEDLAMYDDRLDGLIEDSEEYENAMADYARTENKIFLIDTFGALKLKTAEDAEKAELFLRNYIKNGKDAFVRKMEQRKEHNRQIREQLILEMHAGEIKDIPNKNELEKISKFTKKFIAEHLAVSDLIPLFSRTMDDVTFENSAHGRIMRMIEDSTEKEQSRIRNANEMFRQVLSDAGVISGTGSNLLNLRNMGKFINASRKVQKTNIYVTEYGAKSSEDGPVNWQAPRPFKQEMVPVEHARKILELINEGVHIDAVIPFDYSDVRSALKKNDIKTGRFVSLYLVNNDIMMLTENEDFEVVSTKIDRKLLPSVDDLISFDPEKLVPIEDLSIHEVESLIREYDSGAELGKSFFTGDDVDDASMKRYFDTERKTVKIPFRAKNPQMEEMRSRMLELSPGEAMQIILTWEQPRYQRTMEWNGWTVETIKALKKWLDDQNPAYMKLAYAMRDYVASRRPELDKAVFNRYGSHLPEHENFWYAQFSGQVADKIQDAGYGNFITGTNISANFLTARKTHRLQIDEHANAISIFMQRELETAHFEAWSENMREIRSVYSSRDIQNVIIEEFGIEAWTRFKDGLELIASGGVNDSSSDLYSMFTSTFITANLAFNFSVAVKQIAGGISYSLYVPPHKLVGNISAANYLNPEYRRFLDYVKNDPYILNRVSGGLSPELAIFVNQLKGGTSTPVADAIRSISMWLSLQGDKISSLTWGFAAYQYFVKQGKKQGMSESDARDFAFRMWKRTTDKTQQSSALKDRNAFNAQRGLVRLLTTYMTSPMQQAASEITAAKAAIKDPSPENLSKFAQRFITNHLIVPFMMNFVTSLFKHGINLADIAEEDWPDYAAGMILGSFDSLFILGKVFSSSLKALMSGKKWYSSGNELILFTALENAMRSGGKIITEPDELEPDEWIRAIGDVAVATPYSPVSTGGLVIKAVERNFRKIKNLIEEL